MPIYRITVNEYQDNLNGKRSNLNSDDMILTVPGHAFAYRNVKGRSNVPGGFRLVNREYFMMELLAATDVECYIEESGRLRIVLDEAPPFYYMEPYLPPLSRLEVFFWE